MPSASSYGPRTLISGRKTVAATATPEAITSTGTYVDSVDVTALTANTTAITVGASGVDHGTQSGIRLNPGDVYTLYDVDLSKVYVDVATAAEGVAYVGVSR